MPPCASRVSRRYRRGLRSPSRLHQDPIGDPHPGQMAVPWVHGELKSKGGGGGHGQLIGNSRLPLVNRDLDPT